MKAFKAYDIRGEWGTDLNETIAYRIGYFLPDVLDTDTYLVGRDMRLSSPTLFDNFTRGLTDRGKNVDFIGLSTTPLVYWTTAKYGYGASQKGTIPARSALAYYFWIESIDNEN